MDILTDSLSLDEIASLELEVLAALLQEKGRGRFKDPEKLAKTHSASYSSFLSPRWHGARLLVNTVLAMYAEMIKVLKKQIKVLDKSIERLVQTIPEAYCLRSIPGIGSVYAAGIIAESIRLIALMMIPKSLNLVAFTGRRNNSIILNLNAPFDTHG